MLERAVCRGDRGSPCLGQRTLVLGGVEFAIITEVSNSLGAEWYKGQVKN